ncbi:potassium-transporting ATPase subunit KdpA [Paludisphaera borealis]|uniref:Potassium-transporting ATPase potassium-binding subunit n=1 Tax=Paludisphaera borealis TaxID=1387353 RepID=A0A1U7CJ30_9BACT|nr:potassium-transporting ATPase subunit KdpA [Paludisphaera borealis]APW58950.1 Potassium-transporting ATPase potassium-binding subunit [Paludisphaera borealis]
MPSTLSWLHPFWAFALPIAMSFPLGWLMWRSLDVPEDRAGRGLDALPMFLRRLIDRRPPAKMDWRRYAFAMLAFNVALFVLSFALLYFQDKIPLLNPDGKGPLTTLGYKDAAGVQHDGADTAVIFNTVCSFVTNTNLQHYSGEQNLSYFSQLAAIVWLMFVTPAAGLCVMLATLRGLRGDKDMGDFYVDLMRGLLFVIIPYCLLVAVLLVGMGVPMTFEKAATAATIDGAATKMETQTIARGPVAALVAIKQAGTNGGGFFGPNSAHPFENPSPWSNMLALVSIIVLPMSSIVMAGLMLKNRKHAMVIYGVMLAFLAAGALIAIRAEVEPSAATRGLPVVQGPNMEGKEVRLGPVAAATWSAITTATSNGSVNSMHDSLNPIAGAVPMSLMMLNVVFSGIGAGFENMLMYIVVAVFIAGLMVGRTPEYLGKKVEAKEVKLAMLAILIHPLLICAGAALFAATDWGAKTTANPGSHGFSEILYEFTSAAANNGSGFEGLADNNPAWNIATGVVLLLGRFPALILPLAVAGFLSTKKRVPQTTGTLRTDNLTFAGMLLGTVLLVGALSFMPAVVLGPIADHLSALKH